MRAALLLACVVGFAVAAPTWKLIDSDIATVDTGGCCAVPGRVAGEPRGRAGFGLGIELCRESCVGPACPRRELCWDVAAVALAHAGVAFTSDTVGFTAATANGQGPEILKTTNGAS